MDVQIGPRTEMTEDRSDQGPKWMHTVYSLETPSDNYNPLKRYTSATTC